MEKSCGRIAAYQKPVAYHFIFLNLKQETENDKQIHL